VEKFLAEVTAGQVGLRHGSGRAANVTVQILATSCHSVVVTQRIECCLFAYQYMRVTNNRMLLLLLLLLLLLQVQQFQVGC
jgi:hypothetical protein